MNHSCLLYTKNSGESYFFRSYIPKDLWEYFKGVKEFRVSLKCSVKSNAQRTAKKLSKVVSEIYDQIRQGMKSLEIEDIKEILRTEIRKQILHAHHVDLGTNEYDETKMQMSMDSVKQREILFMDLLKNDMRSHQQELDVKLEEILKSLGIEFKKDSVPYKKLRSHFTKLYTLRFQWMRELIDVTGKSDDDFRRDAQRNLGLELFPELSDQTLLNQSDIKTRTVQEPIKTSISAIPINTSGECLSLCSEKYLERKRIGGVIEKSIITDRNFFKDFIKIVGDIDFSQLTRKEVSGYIDVQIKLPPNKEKSPKYRSLSISDLVRLELPDKETQSPLNINKKLTRLLAFGNWGVREGYLDFNPFKDMKLSVKIRPDERKPFSERDLKIILKPEVYIKNTIGFQNGISKMKFCYYWSFIVGIFTGMRTNEIAQLRVEDIQKDSSIWFFHVEESENTKVKTRNSIRRIPIHPQLVELGFLDYAEKIRKEKKDRVFWELNKSREGYGRQLSRHFNVKYLPLVGVWEKNIKVLYCTRHTFINKLFSEKWYITITLPLCIPLQVLLLNYLQLVPINFFVIHF